MCETLELLLVVLLVNLRLFLAYPFWENRAKNWWNSPFDAHTVDQHFEGFAYLAKLNCSRHCGL